MAPMRWSGPRVRGWLMSVVVLGSACGGGEDRAETPPRPEAPVPGVRVSTADQRTLERAIAFTGELVAERRVALAPETIGRVVELAVEEGDTVEPGQVLARLDAALADRRVAEAEAALRSATAREGEAAAQLARDRNEVARREPLAARDAFPTAELDRLRDVVAVGEQSLEVAAAERARAAAAVSLARVEAERHVVRAPLPGVVVDRAVSVGAIVSPQSPIVTLVDPESLRFAIRLPEHALGIVAPGNEATIELDGWAGGPLVALVERLGGTVDRGSRTVEVLLRVAATEGLREGMFGQGRIVTERAADATVVPAAALETTPEGAWRVWIVRDDAVQPVDVGVSMRVGDEVAVTGLDPGATVVVSPPMGLAPGKTVHVVGEPAEAVGPREGSQAE